jgi:RNA polymerase sigma-70 factor (ECF subfamily)
MSRDELLSRLEDMDVEPYEELRPLLFSIAYGMLGSVGEAEDVVQEAFLRFHRVVADGQEIASPKAYLSAVTTRICIDQLRSARVRREQYVGQWLPEPIVTQPDAAEYAATADSLSMAFLVLLETLSPVERAVFLLREVFDYGYDEIARVVGKSDANCRQLYVRARRHVDEGKPRFDASREQRNELARRFFAAAEEGDVEALERMLADDVVVYGDGGGKAPSWPRPIVGRHRVARLMAGTLAQVREHSGTWRPTEVNGQPGVVFLAPDGRIASVMSVDVADGVIQTIRGIINPDKLAHLGPVADVRALLRERRRWM